MRYLIYYARSILQVLATVLLAWLLAPRVGMWMTILLFALWGALAAAAGGVLLKRSEVGTVNWKNRAAALLAPWGWHLARGRLAPALCVSGTVWTLLGTTGALLSTTHLALPASKSDGTLATVVTALLALAWLVDGAACLWALSTLMRDFSPRTSHTRTLMKVLGVCVGIVAASVCLFLLGRPYLALVVAGGPPLALGTIMGLYVLAIICLGKNLRWN